MSNPGLDELVERAFDYRGYVTVLRRDGSELVGYLYDRGPAHVDLLDESATTRTRLARDEIEDIRFTGDDPVLRSQQIWERRKGKLEPVDAPAYGEWDDSRPVLLVVALEQELRQISRALGLKRRGQTARGRAFGTDLVAHAVGMGGGAARAVAAEEPRLVLSCGFCGALDPRLEAGDLVLATSVQDEGGNEIQAPPAPLERARRALSGLRLFEGRLLCTTSVAATPAEKLALTGSGAIALDMETHPIARAAAHAGIPWLAVRAVIDPAHSTLPPFVREPQRGYVVPAILHALSGPRGAMEMVRTAKQARLAGASVREAVHRLIEAQP